MKSLILQKTEDKILEALVTPDTTAEEREQKRKDLRYCSLV
jgi:hypothetical protein